MARRSIPIDEKIAKQKEVVFTLKDKYETAVAELDSLVQKKREIESKEILKAIQNSKRSVEEILEFLNDDDGR